MRLGNFSSLQSRVVGLLSDMEPPWTLTGGAALVGVHLGHRTTRDLDLFWHGQPVLGPWVDEVEERLVRAGLEVAVLQRSPAFLRLLVRA